MLFLCFIRANSYWALAKMAIRGLNAAHQKSVCECVFAQGVSPFHYLWVHITVCVCCRLLYQIKVIDQLWVNMQELRPLGSINRSLCWLLIGSGYQRPVYPTALMLGPIPTLRRLRCQEDGSDFGFAGPKPSRIIHNCNMQERWNAGGYLLYLYLSMKWIQYPLHFCVLSTGSIEKEIHQIIFLVSNQCVADLLSMMGLMTWR